MFVHPEEVPSAIKRYQDEIQRVLSVLETHLQDREWYDRLEVSPSSTSNCE